MKVFIVCSKAFYDNLPQVEKELTKAGHEYILPVNKDNPTAESKLRETPDHAKYKADAYAKSRKIIKSVDAILVLNYAKRGTPNYIGGATFLQMYEAFMDGKKIFIMNPIPEGTLKDEIIGFGPIVINGNIKKFIK